MQQGGQIGTAAKSASPPPVWEPINPAPAGPGVRINQEQPAPSTYRPAPAPAQAGPGGYAGVNPGGPIILGSGPGGGAIGTKRAPLSGVGNFLRARGWIK